MLASQALLLQATEAWDRSWHAGLCQAYQKELEMERASMHGHSQSSIQSQITPCPCIIAAPAAHIRTVLLLRAGRTM